MDDSFPRSLATLRSLLKSTDSDALLISGDSDVYHLSQFPCTYGKILLTQKKIFFITDSRYKLDAENHRWLGKHFELRIQEKGLPALLNELTDSEKIHSCLLDAKEISMLSLQKLKREIPKIKFRPHKTEIDFGRATKDSREVRKIVIALRIAEKSFLETLPLIKPGISEKDIRTELEYRFMRNGADDKSFESIIAAGKNAATPHAHATKRKIRNGEMIIMDFGVKKDGYCSDTTRTVHVGKANTLFKKRYECVRKAMIESGQICHEGNKTKDVDQLARDILRQEKLESFFTHSLGHGCGVDVHEEPSLNPKSTATLANGMVVTIEPGIYIEQWGGIRIEDMVLVQRKHPRILTRLDNALIEL